MCKSTVLIDTCGGKESEKPGRVMASNEKDVFIHSLSNTKFSERNKAIFGELSALESKHEDGTTKEDPFAESYTEKGKPRRPKKVPDHVLHPEKWTKYSLEEDGTAVLIGEGSKGVDLNKEIALEFISSLRERKAKEVETKDDKMENSEVSNLDVPVGLKRKRDEVEKEDEQAAVEEHRGGRGTAVMMKTYEFGKGHAKKATLEPGSRKSEDVREKVLTLPHLDDEADNDGSNEAAQTDEGNAKKTKALFHVVRKDKKHLRKTEPSDDE